MKNNQLEKNGQFFFSLTNNMMLLSMMKMMFIDENDWEFDDANSFSSLTLGLLFRFKLDELKKSVVIIITAIIC